MKEEKHIPQYVIVTLDQPSYEHSFLFWKPKGLGYTSNLRESGSWSKEDAMRLTKNNTCNSNIAICYEDILKICYIKHIVDWNEMDKFKTTGGLLPSKEGNLIHV